MPAEVLLVLGAVAAVGGYLVACRWWPFAACHWCRGVGKKRSTGTPFFIAGGALSLAGLAADMNGLVLAGAVAVAPGLFVRGGSFRDCRHCRGTGRRIRSGRRFVRPSK